MSADDHPWGDIRNARREVRAEHGIPCPDCVRLLPRAQPTILLPQQRCKIHGYRDPRGRTNETDVTRRAGFVPAPERINK